jgi:histone H3-like centromeric protein A
MRQNLGEASTPGSARKRGRPGGKSVPVDMGPKKAGKRLSTGGKGKGKRVSTGSAIERELALDMETRVKSLRGIGNGRDEMGC